MGQHGQYDPLHVTTSMKITDEEKQVLRGRYDEAVHARSQAQAVTDETIERAIDFMENNGIPLLPWQATAFRRIMGSSR